MSRLLPRSLLGQVMTSVMLALLIAQVIGGLLVYRAGTDRLELAALTTLSAQLAFGAERPNRSLGPPLNRPQGRPQSQPRGPRLRPPPDIEAAPMAPVARLPRPLLYRISPTPEVALTRKTTASAMARRLLDLLKQDGIAPHNLAVETRLAGMDPQLLAYARERPRAAANRQWRERRIYVATVQRTPQSDWETVRTFERRPPSNAGAVLIAQTLLIYAVLCAMLYFVLRRITRPLAQLTERVGDFSKAPDRAVLLEETGPSDTRRLIAAHNAMEARISALLDEKDVMLGAIGHDLKTPLAALRVRIESVPDEAQRSRMAASIEDITRTLDDILSLARIGRASDEAYNAEAVDISALADGVVEEFEDLGEPVTLELIGGRSARLVGRVQETWLKRGLRNLVSNAVRYGGAAFVSVFASEDKDGRTLILRVEDNGVGIPEDQIAAMLEPFKRGDASRSRATGGAGLGLTLARAIAEAHRGKLVIENRYEGGTIQGLRAEIRIPVAGVGAY
ncbi:MAG: HAMP domain-containing sensor histidine kinase [Pseudomonadota bacterium]